MRFLVDFMRQAAHHGSVEDRLSIIAYGDRALERGSCADPELVEELVLLARVTLQIEQQEWLRSG